MSLRTLVLLPALTLPLLGCPGGGSAPAPQKTKTAAAATPKKTKAPEKPKKPFVRAELKTPWKDAKVGQFAVYEMKQMGGKKMRFEVTKVEDRTVTYKITRPGGGSSEDTIDLAEKDEKYQVPTELLGVLKDKIEDKKMKVGEAEISVKVIKRELKGGGSTENWITTELPPFMEALSGSATAQSSKDGAVHFILVEFGGAK
jgi:hypothetical protein